MLGVKYIVEIALEATGGLNPKMEPAMDRVRGKAGALGNEFAKIGGKLADGFTGAVENVGAKLGSLAKYSGAAALAGVTYGVIGLNKELETSQVSIAAVLNAHGVTNGIEAGMERATGLIQAMRKDAQRLPGEFSDLFGIFQTGIGSALNAGLDDAQFEKLAANAMAAGKALAVPLDEAGRELALLLDGRAGAHNKLGTRLGIDAHSSYQGVKGEAGGFNQLSGASRVKVITDALEKFEPAIEVFGRTFDAQSSTFVDNAKMFIGASTKDLFGRVTGTLADINDWFNHNRDTVQLWADKVSGFLVHAWDDGRAAAVEWWPSISHFAENLYDKFVMIWHDAEPYVKRIGAAVKGMLDDPGTVDKLITLLKLYAVVKVGSGAAGVVSAGSSLVGAAGGWGGIGGALSSAGGAIGGAVGGIGGGALVTGGIVTATLAALGATGYEIYSARSAAETLDAKGGGAYGYSAGAQSYVDAQVQAGVKSAIGLTDIRDQYRAKDAVLPAFNPLMQSYEQYAEQVRALQNESAIANDRLSAFGQSAVDASDAASELAFIISGLAKSGDFEAISKINAGAMDAQQANAFANQDTERQNDFFSQSSAAMGIAAVKSLDAQAAQAKKREDSLKGRGQVNIAKVEITVSSNQAPGQIARDVAKELGTMRKFALSSPGVRNFGAGR